MAFGLDKCVKASFINGRLETNQHIEMSDLSAIKTLDQANVYK